LPSEPFWIVISSKIQLSLNSFIKQHVWGPDPARMLCICAVDRPIYL